MAKHTSNAYMTPGEQMAGTIFLALDLFLLPALLPPVFRFVGALLGTAVSQEVQQILYYDVLLVVAVVIFHGFLGRTSRQFAGNLGGSCRSMAVGLIALYGLNELAYRLIRLLFAAHTNLNDGTIAAQVSSVPRITFVIAVFLSPFVEEVLFRGLIFGNLRGKSRTVAYLVSALLFALSDTWQVLAVQQDLAAVLTLAQYLVPGLVLCWVYDESGSLWAPIGLHAVFNALCLLLIR